MHGVPFAGWVCGVDFGVVESVEPAGFLWVMAVNVVDDLDFWAGLPWFFFDFLDVVHEAAVAFFRYHVVELDFEAAVLLLGHEVAAAFCDEGDDAVFELPFRSYCFFLVDSEVREVSGSE